MSIKLPSDNKADPVIERKTRQGQGQGQGHRQHLVLAPREAFIINCLSDLMFLVLADNAPLMGKTSDLNLGKPSKWAATFPDLFYRHSSRNKSSDFWLFVAPTRDAYN